VLATLDREPELVDVVALHLLERHFAPGLHEEILESVGLELAAPVDTRHPPALAAPDATYHAAAKEPGRRAMFRAAAPLD
jgi:hypothetical protein